MGTPDFAVPSLRGLVEASEPGKVWAAGLTIAGVITRPDRPAGRGRQVAFSPVKQYALDAGLAVYQPGSLRRSESLALLRELAPDLIIVAAFGQILPPDVLNLPATGCLNIHASLLPRWRGAAPIAAAIREGDAETGVTIMRMEEGLDTGPIVSSRVTAIHPNETAGALTDRLAELGATLLIETLPAWLGGQMSVTPQDDAQATMTRPLRKEDGRLDWRLPADDLARLVRAMSPWPGAFTTWNGKLLKVLDAVAIPRSASVAPGVCFPWRDADSTDVLGCACGSGALALRVIQLEGKRALSSAELVRGHPGLSAATLGS
ncbi:MAG TPA: methionyl-tRNA formyltransferase [Ktedonobacterales bacterium]